MKDISIQYQIGLKSWTRKLPIENLTPIQEQFQISYPLITGATIEYLPKKELKIHVGKEINLQNISLEKYKIKKYQIDINALTDLFLKGYQRACLLNYKKYDQILIGLNKEEIIVPDYYALKRIVEKFCEVKCNYASKFNRV